MFKNLSLNLKVIGSIIAVLAIISIASFFFTRRHVNDQAESAFRDKAPADHRHGHADAHVVLGKY